MSAEPGALWSCRSHIVVFGYGGSQAIVREHFGALRGVPAEGVAEEMGRSLRRRALESGGAFPPS